MELLAVSDCKKKVRNKIRRLAAPILAVEIKLPRTEIFCQRQRWLLSQKIHRTGRHQGQPPEQSGLATVFRLADINRSSDDILRLIRKLRRTVLPSMKVARRLKKGPKKSLRKHVCLGVTGDLGL